LRRSKAENANDLEQLLARYGIGSDSDPARRMLHYQVLLEKWNRRINLVSSTSWNILGPLFEEAVWAARFYISRDESHLDIGSGAGFPALPLCITTPGMKLELVESRSRKAIFLETAITGLGLENCTVHTLRLTDFLNREGDRSWSSVSWKGVRLGRADLDLLLRRCTKETSIWIFHGRELPVEDPSLLDDYLRLGRRETIPGRKDSFLSIYEKRR